MTRSEAYAEGFQEGRREAEEDLANEIGLLEPCPPNLYFGEIARAGQNGRRRGYRDTVARYEAGTLTRQMFEHAPRGGTR